MPPTSTIVRQKPNGGETNEWYTPPSIFEALGLQFDLDPCTPPGGLAWIPATRTLSYRDDGLSERWEGRVWLNPPYGPHTGEWLAKLADHGDGIALVFARTDVRWFQALAPRADALLLIRGRLRFLSPHPQSGSGHGGAAAPSCLLAYGEANAAAVERSGLGICFRSVGSA